MKFTQLTPSIIELRIKADGQDILIDTMGKALAGTSRFNVYNVLAGISPEEGSFETAELVIKLGNVEHTALNIIATKENGKVEVTLKNANGYNSLNINGSRRNTENISADKAAGYADIALCDITGELFGE